MAKLYSKTTNSIQLNPKKETIKFLLDYSKAISVIDCKQEKFKVVLN